jgi:hypothetical protein
VAALVGVPAGLRAVLAAHVSFQLMDRRCLRPADNVQGDGLMGVAAEAFYLKVEVAGVQCITKRRGGLGGSLKAEHALVPGLAGETVGGPARLGGPLRRGPDRGAVDRLS